MGKIRRAVKFKITAVLVAIIVLSAVAVVIVQERNQVPPTQTVEFWIYVKYPVFYMPNFYMDVDGTRYYNSSAIFYWSVGSTHTVTVPNEIKNPKYPYFKPESWRLSLPKSNTVQVTVENYTSMLENPNILRIFYDNYNG